MYRDDVDVDGSVVAVTVAKKFEDYDV